MYLTSLLTMQVEDWGLQEIAKISKPKFDGIKYWFSVTWKDGTKIPQYIWHLVRGNCAVLINNYFEDLMATNPVTAESVYNEWCTEMRIYNEELQDHGIENYELKDILNETNGDDDDY